MDGAFVIYFLDVFPASVIILNFFLTVSFFTPQLPINLPSFKTVLIND